MATKKAAAPAPQFLSGFIDATGSTVIPARYEIVGNFRSGWAPVCVGGKWGSIDKRGEFGFEPRYDLLKDFDDGRAIFRDNGQWGVVDTAGKLLLAPQAAQVHATSSDAVLIKGEKGLALIAYDGKPRLEGLMDFFAWKEGRAVAVVDGRAGVVDNAARWVVEPTYDAIYSYAEGYAAFERAGLAGWLDLKGKEAIPATFEAAFDFSDGLARVRQGDLFGFADTTGKLVIPCTFADATNFRDGVACVRLEKFESAAIDKTGKIIWKPPFPWVSKVGVGSADWTGFVKGRAIVMKSELGRSFSGFVDTKGKLVVEPAYANAENYTPEGVAAVEYEREKWGLIDRDGKLVARDFTRKPVFSEGLASMRMLNQVYEDQQEAVELGAKFEATITKFNTKLEAALEKAGPAVQKYAKAVMDTVEEPVELTIYDMNDFGIVVSNLADMDTVEIKGREPLGSIAKLFEGGIMQEPKTRKGIQRAAEAYNAASKRWFTWFAEQFRAAGKPKVAMFAHGEDSDDWIDLRTGKTMTEEQARKAI